MTRQISFSSHERRVLRQFRGKMSRAESKEDVKKVFMQSVEGLLKAVLDKKVILKAEDIALLPDSKPHYQMSDGLRDNELLKPYWVQSDLPHVIQRLAESAIGRQKHLEKHPEKTEAKIRM